MPLRTAIASLALAAAVVMAPGAIADPVRSSATKLPALEVDPPAGWDSERQADSPDLAFLIAPDHSGLLSYGVIGGDDDGAMPSMSELAASLARGEDSQLLAGSEAASVDGRKGQAFRAVHPAAAGKPELDSRYVLAVLDPHHVAVVATAAFASATPAQRRAIDAVAGQVRVVTSN